jgi:putative intracellular protease/amidase
MKPIAALLAGLVCFTSVDAQESRPDHGRKRSVAVLVFDGVELLDCTGPIEAFSSGNGFDEPFRVFTVTAGPNRTVKSRNVATLVADYTVADCPPCDILVIPGGETRCLDKAYPLGKFILDREPNTEVVMSVCNGVFALSSAGLLDGLEATTHHAMLGFLRRGAPKTTVRADRRFVDNGHIATAAGVSAGIDGALHLIARFTGPDNARNAAGRMQYEWKDAPVADSRPVDPIEAAKRLWYWNKWKEAAAAYEPIVASNPKDAVALARLGTARAFSKDFEGGIQPLESAIALGLREDYAFQALAFAKKRLGRHDEALAAMKTAYELNPSFEIMRELGALMSEAGDHAAALPLMKAAWEHGIGDSSTLGRIALAQIKSGDRAAALATLRLIAAEDPEDNPDFAALLADEAFAPLAADPAFRALRESAPASRPK